MFLLFYIFMGAVWAAHAFRMQSQITPGKKIRIVVCTVLNFLLWPLTLTLAVFKNWL